MSSRRWCGNRPAGVRPANPYIEGAGRPLIRSGFPAKRSSRKYQGIMTDLAVTAEKPTRSPLAEEVARRAQSGVLVMVFPDGAEKYLTESFWLAEE